MKRSGVVSVWVGYFDDEEAVFDYVEKSYPSEGEGVSEFLRDFPVGPYDEDLAEIAFVQDDGPIERALRSTSYADSFVPELAAQLESESDVNSLYFIFDLDASSVAGRRGKLRFLDVFVYTKGPQ